MSAVLAMPSAPELTFRPLRESDLEAVAAIEADVYVFPWSQGNFRDSLLAAYQCTGVWVGDELVGYSIVLTAVDEAHLLNLAVASRWQRRGIGAQFLAWLIRESRQRQMEMLYLEVRPSNLPGRALYERFGFRQLGLRRNYYPALTGREDALFLGLNLADDVD